MFDATGHVNVLPSLPQPEPEPEKGREREKKVQSFVSTSLNKCVLWLRWKGDNSQHVWQVFSVWVFICTWLHAGVITPWFLPSTRSLSITVSVRSACILPIPSSAESSKKNKQTKKKIVHPQNLCRLYMLCQAVHSLKNTGCMLWNHKYRV